MELDIAICTVTLQTIWLHFLKRQMPTAMLLSQRHSYFLATALSNPYYGSPLAGYENVTSPAIRADVPVTSSDLSNFKYFSVKIRNVVLGELRIHQLSSS